jgi:DNA-binding MarR family transcriptional regulator
MHMHHEALDICVCTALRKASRALTRLYDDALAPHGLTTTQFALMRVLAREGELVLSTLASRLVMDRTTLYRAVGPLERQGWIEVHDADRGRKRLALITNLGRARIGEAETAWRQIQAEVFDRLGAEAWRDLTATSDRVVALAKS